MKKSGIVYLLAAMLLIVMQGPAEAGDVLFYEGFETPPHTVGEHPVGWLSRNNNAHYVTDSRACVGENSCRFAAAPYWAGDRYHSVDVPTEGRIIFSVCMQQSSESTTTYDNSNFETQLRGVDWIAQMAFRPIKGSGNTKPYLRVYGCPDLGESFPITLDHWHHMEARIDPATRTADYFIDGTLVCENVDITYDATRDGITNAVVFGAGNIEDGSIVGYWDEIKVETVDTAVEVAVDIKPQSCPNPLNVKSKGVLPVAILGSDSFDVSQIDVTSIEILGVRPIRSSFEDVTAPLTEDASPEDCLCASEEPDGFMDLTLKFDRQEIVEAIGPVEDSEMIILTLTGLLQDGTPIEGTDCILIKNKCKK